jgi:hypothetical protein
MHSTTQRETQPVIGSAPVDFPMTYDVHRHVPVVVRNDDGNVIDLADLGIDMALDLSLED